MNLQTAQGWTYAARRNDLCIRTLKKIDRKGPLSIATNNDESERAQTFDKKLYSGIQPSSNPREMYRTEHGALRGIHRLPKPLIQCQEKDFGVYSRGLDVQIKLSIW